MKRTVEIFNAMTDGERRFLIYWFDHRSGGPYNLIDALEAIAVLCIWYDLHTPKDLMKYYQLILSHEYDDTPMTPRQRAWLEAYGIHEGETRKDFSLLSTKVLAS